MEGHFPGSSTGPRSSPNRQLDQPSEKVLAYAPGPNQERQAPETAGVLADIASYEWPAVER